MYQSQKRYPVMLSIPQLNQYIEATLRGKGISARSQEKLSRDQSKAFEIYYQPLQKFNPLAFMLDTISYLGTAIAPTSRRVCFLFVSDLGQYRAVLVEQLGLDAQLAKELAADISKAKDNNGQMQLNPDIQEKIKKCYQKIRCVILGDDIAPAQVATWTLREIPIWRELLSKAYVNPQIQVIPIGNGAQTVIAELAAEFLLTGNLNANLDAKKALTEHIQLAKEGFTQSLNQLRTLNSGDYANVMKNLVTLTRYSKLREYLNKLQVNFAQDSADALQKKHAIYQDVKKQIDDKPENELITTIQRGQLEDLRLLMEIMSVDIKERIACIGKETENQTKEIQTWEKAFQDKITELEQSVAAIANNFSL